MVIKISGVRDPENIDRIVALNPIYVAIDFRPDSEKYVGQVDYAIYSHIPKKIRRVGIFHNSDPIQMIAMAGQFGLHTLQLEGDQSVAECEMIGAEGMELIKTIDKNWQFDKYEGVCNKFLIRDAALNSSYSGQTPIIIDFKAYDDGDFYGVDIKEEDIDEWISFFNKY